MLKLEEIPRVKAGTVSKGGKSLDTLDQERLYLATRASDLLGYRALTADVTGERLVSKGSGKLTEALLKLEMTVLDTATVIDYQMDEAGRRTKEHILENFQQWVVGYFTAASWTHTRLSDYERPVPEFVLDKAIKLKEAMPEVEFHVQHMTDPKADPFLVATYNKEIYYLEAWDEPRFEGRARI